MGNYRHLSKLLPPLLVAWVASCNSQTTPDVESAKALQELQSHVAMLQGQVDGMNIVLENASREIGGLRDEVSNTQSLAILDCADHGYGATHTLGTSLVLLVTCEDVKSYLSGSKVRLKIGNPNAIAFSGLDYTVVVGADSFKALSTMTGPDNSKKISGKLTETFRPAYWTGVDISVPDNKPDTLRWIVIQLTTNQVSLYK